MNVQNICFKLNNLILKIQENWWFLVDVAQEWKTNASLITEEGSN